MPLILIVALLFSGVGGGGSAHPKASGAVLPPVSVPASDLATADATVSTCAQVISALPLDLAGAKLRQVTSTPPSSSIVAWGDPAIVFRCGVPRPKALNPSLTIKYLAVDNVLFLPDRQDKQTLFTVVDRGIYFEVTVPLDYDPPPISPIAAAIARVLPTPVCVADPTQSNAKQCTRRK